MTNPEPNVISINDLRSKHIGKSVTIEGIINQVSEVQREITAETFECTSCGQRITILQDEPQRKTPSVCECGRRCRFDSVKKKSEDVQHIKIEQAPEMKEYGFSPKIIVVLRGSLMDPTFRLLGEKMRVTGTLKDNPQTKEVYVDATTLVSEKPRITLEDEKKIKELAANPKIYDLLVKSIAPSIYGYDDIKLAIALQLFGGARKVLNNKITGDINILLVGDSQSEVSQLLRYLPENLHNAKCIKWKSTECLTAVVKNDCGDKAIEAGALVLANNGLCILEELNKMKKENKNAIERVIDKQIVIVDNAKSQQIINTHTSILAAASPKFGHFDVYESIPKQIDIPEPLISRFDLIFIVRDTVDKEKDTLLAKHILNISEAPEAQSPSIDTDTLRKYIDYAKSISPKITPTVKKEIERFYVGCRSDRSFMDATKVETIIRLSEASTKIRLSDKITGEDVKRAIDLMTDSRQKLGIDTETKADLYGLEFATTNEERNKTKILLSIIEEMQSESPDNAVPLKDVVAAAEDQGIQGAEKIISKLKSMGEVFESKPRHIRKV